VYFAIFEAVSDQVKNLNKEKLVQQQSSKETL
jgi:hypothetical protein